MRLLDQALRTLAPCYHLIQSELEIVLGGGFRADHKQEFHKALRNAGFTIDGNTFYKSGPFFTPVLAEQHYRG